MADLQGLQDVIQSGTHTMTIVCMARLPFPYIVVAEKGPTLDSLCGRVVIMLMTKTWVVLVNHVLI